jgi:hypothetical protein
MPPRFGSERTLAALHHERNQGGCNTADGSAARRNCGIRDRREIKWLPVHGVRKSPFIEATRQ